MEKLENKIGKRVPFKVPEAYFDSLSERIINRVEECKDIEPALDIPQKKSPFAKFRIYISVAAAAVVALLLINIVYTKVVSKVVEETYVETSVTANNDFSFDYDFDVTNEEIIEYLSSSVKDVESFYASIQ